MAETLDCALDDEVLEKADRVLKLACERELKLATAESCTGGLLATLLTDIPGCSHAFERGFVVYSEKAKCELLSIQPERIANCGAVSKEVAIEMAQGALIASEADVAVSITGFAGPGENGDEEGLVHIACVTRGSDPLHREEHFGTIGRAGVRRATVDVALTMIEEAAMRA